MRKYILNLNSNLNPNPNLNIQLFFLVIGYIFIEIQSLQ
jgi:hypothetical protein